MRTPTQYDQYAAAHLTRPNGGAWATVSGSFCVQLVFEAGGFPTPSFDNASVAANYVLQRHGLDLDYRTALPGEFHYWGTGAGHVAFQSATHPGQLLMASSFASSLAPGLGYMPITSYGVPTGHGHTYMGHSPFFGDHTLAAELDPSGGGGTPVIDPSEDIMAYTILAANDAPLLNTWAYIGLPNSFVFSGDANVNLAQKQLVAAINGVASVANLVVTPISSVGMQNAINLINTTWTQAQITSLGQTVATGITVPVTDLTPLENAVSAIGTEVLALGTAVGKLPTTFPKTVTLDATGTLS